MKGLIRPSKAGAIRLEQSLIGLEIGATKWPSYRGPIGSNRAYRALCLGPYEVPNRHLIGPLEVGLKGPE